MRNSKTVVSLGGAVGNGSSRPWQASTAPPSTAGDNSWIPRGFLVRGWAPFGCPAKQRTGEIQAKAHINEILSLLPELERAAVRPAVPFATNHHLFFSVPSGEQHCRRIVDILKAKVVEKQYKISGKEVTVSVETSPTRKAQCKIFFDACRALESVGLDESKVMCCQKGLRIYSAENNELLGSGRDGRWTCTPQLDTLGVPNLAARLQADVHM